MKYIDEFENKEVVSGLIDRINKLHLSKKIKIMEVCGTHTRSIFKNGINNIFSKKIELISGPGCPICVTSETYIDQAILLARQENIIITTFADLLRVPGTDSTLQKEQSRGRDIRTVYSPLEAVNIAVANPDQEVVFLAVGFETTIPVIALSVEKAKKSGITNYSLLQSLKIMPPVLQELVRDQEVEIDGFILPGHVCTITGAKVFSFLAREYQVPGVITGFEAGDIIMALYSLCQMLQDKKSRVKNQYSRFVKREGNQKALELINKVFTEVDSCWRGIGTIYKSGLKLKDEYAAFSSENKFECEPSLTRKNTACICGEILKGKKQPQDCKLFSTKCSPLSPVGPCMVSLEGTCAAYYQYQGKVIN